jgi:Ran GTPase-activating protein (RanGAP) involved in mRNA processing and transport
MYAEIMPRKIDTSPANMKLEQNPPTKRVQLEIKINISIQQKEIESKFPYSQSISFRLNPFPVKTDDQHFSSALYFNPKLTQRINQFQAKLHVDLSYFHLIDADMTIIARQVIREKKCTELWLYGNQFTSKGAAILAASLRNNSTLKYLDLSYNQISDQGVRILSEALLPNQNSSLKALYLSKNRISNLGAKYLSEMLRTNQTLTELWLSSNEISFEGIQQLAHVLTYHNKTLKCLSLSTNIFLTDLCLNSLINMLEHNQTLKYLWMTDCNLTEQGKLKLKQIADRKENFRIEL